MSRRDDAYDDEFEEDEEGYSSFDENDGEKEETFSEYKDASASIREKCLQDREMVKQRMIREDSIRKSQVRHARKKMQQKWKRKMKRSPYNVNLVAQSQKIEEETRFRNHRQQKSEKLIRKRKEKLKNEIILKALSEESDLLALRDEKRAILMEERRLKALLDLERANLRRKQDLLAAQRAERKRHQAKIEHRRQKYTQQMEAREREKMLILKEKFGLK